jgi:hypothetical protein
MKNIPLSHLEFTCLIRHEKVIVRKNGTPNYEKCFFKDIVNCQKFTEKYFFTLENIKIMPCSNILFYSIRYISLTFELVPESSFCLF